MGCLRLILALSVFCFHHNIGKWRGLPYSFTAVLCFFIISGFYMHMVISEKYGVSRDGLKKFYLNRVLRLFPVYWATLVAWQLAHAAGLIREKPFTSVAYTLEQLALLPSVLWSNLVLEPGVADHLFLGQTYTIGMELAFYLATPLLVICAGRTLALVWVISFAALLVPHWLRLPEDPWQYEFIPTIFVFFVTGACSYRLMRALNAAWLPNQAVAAFFAVALAAYCYWVDDAHVQEWISRPAIFGLYLLVALAIPFLFRATRASRLDGLLGELSYPLYVCQGLAVTLAVGGAGPTSNLQRAAALGAALLMSVVLIAIVERPVERLRRRISERRQHSTVVSPATVEGECSEPHDWPALPLAQ